jgi:15-cis-phytoene synthase
VQSFVADTNRARPNLGAEPPPGLPGLDTVRLQARSENFPVALRVLPRPLRVDLLAVYGFARLADDIGDRYDGDRLAALEWLEHDLDLAASGQASHPAVHALTPTIRRHGLALDPFRDLIEANRRDQRQHRYATFDELLDYCRLSANPVGRTVLAILGVTDPDRALLSDDVCSGLQVVEHLQDVGEDLAAGRVYLPQDDLFLFGCTDDDLRQPTANSSVRKLIAHMASRARILLAAGQQLVAGLPTVPGRIAVAGFVAGGLATLDAIRAAGFDVLVHRCRPTRRGVASHAAALLARSIRSETAQDGPAQVRARQRQRTSDHKRPAWRPGNAMVHAVELSYVECTRITRTEAKNFAYGISLLPGPKRDAMSALYAFARRIDDISDSSRSVDDKLAALSEVDEQIAALAAGELPDRTDAVLVGVHHAFSSFDIRVTAFAEIVEGCRRDATGATYATLADTEEYCRLVAGAVGRLSLGVFGSTDPNTAPAFADDLGVALQLTNILRDVVEDREMGRVYLPADDIGRFGCEPDLGGPAVAVAKLVEHYVGVAEGFYERGLPLLPLLDRRSRACVAAMAGIYRGLLRRIEADPAAVLRGRVSLPTREKLWVAVRSLAGGGTR